LTEQTINVTNIIIQIELTFWINSIYPQDKQMPNFLAKNSSAPIFKSKSDQLLADAFRATASWTEDVDIDVVAMFLKNGLPTQDPMSIIYQAGTENPQTRTLKIGETLVGTLFDDDVNGEEGNNPSDTLEAALYFNKKGQSVGYDSVIFSVLSYKGFPLKKLQNPCIKVEPLTLNDGRFVQVPGTQSYSVSFADIGEADTMAIVTIAYLDSNGSWQWKNITKGISTKIGRDALGDFWEVGSTFFAQNSI
jgi:hypothetical protein